MKWDDLRIFLAVARAGSFSAAARTLGVNQSTVSRRLSAMEDHLNTQLIERGGEGADLTAAGSELLALAGNVEEEVLRIDRRVAGRDQRLSGRLRVTCVDMMVDRYLAPHIGRFCTQNPDIEFSLLTPFQPVDLERREADVAIRVSVSPPEPLVGRRLMDFALGVYGSSEVVETLPVDPNPTDLQWIGWESETYTRRMILDHFPSARVFHKVDSLFVLNAMVGQGLGVSVLPCYWADREPGLRRVYATPVSGSSHGLWVLTHPDIRRAARVRAFVRFITGVFESDRDLFEGRQPACHGPSRA